MKINLLDFLRRQNLSVRKVSCIKTMSLENSIKKARKYFKGFENLLADPTFAQSLDPDAGRFTFACRFNKDEVPLRFGSVSPCLDTTGTSNVHVRSLPGWGDRIATMVPVISAEGKIFSPLVLIFRGQGNVSTQELNFYANQSVYMIFNTYL